MSEEFGDELSAEEREAFASLVREKMPGTFLEDRVVESLKQAKLILPTQNIWRRPASRIGLAVAASLLFLILGAVIGVKWLTKPAPKNSPTDFILVLRAEPEQSRPRSADEESGRAKEYGAWARQLMQQGVTIDGEKLKDQVRILQVADGRAVVSENRPVSKQEDIAGYFLIGAQDYEHAVRIAEGCPHLKYGGKIEVRQIDRF